MMMMNPQRQPFTQTRIKYSPGGVIKLVSVSHDHLKVKLWLFKHVVAIVAQVEKMTITCSTISMVFFVSLLLYQLIKSGSIDWSKCHLMSSKIKVLQSSVQVS